MNMTKGEMNKQEHIEQGDKKHKQDGYEKQLLIRPQSNDGREEHSVMNRKNSTAQKGRVSTE